jgi:Protein of unknown function (DUF551)
VYDRRTDDATLIEAVRILSRTVRPDDGVVSACLAEAAKRLAELVEERRWIPVGERLPPDNVAVLCWVDGCGAEMVWREKGQWFLSFAGWGISDFTYTHWRPLPPGPEVEG